MGDYMPSAAADQQAMLKEIGIEDIKELFAAVPEKVKLSGALKLPAGKSEMEVYNQMTEMAAKNKVYSTVLRGAGAYDHYIPSIVKYITAKEEFVTAYTPYQAEISQGVLQSIFEYQTMICRLTGMDAANASVYDGATAAAEAVAMCRDRKKTVALISEAVHPDTLATVKTYCYAADQELRIVPAKEGRTDIERLQKMLNDKVCCLYLQQPNFYGQLEEAEQIGELVHSCGAKYIMGCNPIALSIIKTPAECGADIAVGEGQPLGMPLSYGGPYLGYMASTNALMRKLPGRIVGQTADGEGNRAFVLTLQAREQHIRREKASSNICSNQALCALTAAVYMSVMGTQGMRQAAEQSMAKAHYLADLLQDIPGIKLRYNGEFFNEFIISVPKGAYKINEALAAQDILGGLPLDGDMLWCVTEKASKEQLDKAAAIVREVCE